jgi:hypothetical protein
MLRHVAVFTWIPEASVEQRQSLRDALGALPGEIPQIRAYTFGDDLGVTEGNAQFAVVADFEDQAAWRTYTDHPAHRRVITELVRPILASRAAVQFEV